MITSPTIESIVKPESSSKNKVETEESAQTLFQKITNDTEDSKSYDSSEAPFLNASSEGDESEMSRSSSMTIEVNSELNSSSENFSESDIFNNNAGFNKGDFNDDLRGNSNSFYLSFRIGKKSDKKTIQKIEWISAQKLVTWSKNSFYLIDLQTRKVTDPLIKKFDKKSVEITQVFFSKSRKTMCIILNNKHAYIIDTESCFDIKMSIDLHELNNNTKSDFVGCFSPKEDQVVFASKNVLFFADLKGDKSLKKIQSSMDFIATYVLWKKRGIVLGTEKGSVFIIIEKKIEKILSGCKMSNKDIKVIYDSSRKNKLKTKIGQIKLISSFMNKSFVIIDSNNKGFFISNNDIQFISNNILSFKRSSKETFLVRLQNYNKLIAINTFGDFSPPHPPCFFSTQKTNISFNSNISNLLDEALKKNEKKLIDSFYHQLFLTNETNHSISLRNSYLLLNQIISFHNSFSSLSSKNFLAPGKLEIARNLLLSTDPSDKEYLNNMMLAALYNKNADNSESVVKNLMTTGLIDEAVHILLITQNSYKAAEILCKFGRNIDAYHILMLNGQKYDSSVVKNLAQKIANSLISEKENILYGLKLLSSFGYIDEMINELSLNLL